MPIRVLLAAGVLGAVLLTGWCAYSDGKGEPIRGPSRAELGDVVIRYSHRSGLAGGDCAAPYGRALSVTSDGRAHVLRGCERAVLTLTSDDFGGLRRHLLDKVSGHEGRHDWSGNVSDQPQTGITVVESGGRVRHVSAVGGSGSLLRHRWFSSAKEKLDALFERTRTSGTVDPAAPILVRSYEEDSFRAATWPRDITPPGRARLYEGREATRLRSVLGNAPDGAVRMPDGTIHSVSWQATLPGFDPPG